MGHVQTEEFCAMYNALPLDGHTIAKVGQVNHMRPRNPAASSS